MICFPNAKINIGLNIIEKRPDGFHNIESIFYPIGLSDVLEIVENKTGTKKVEFLNSGLQIDGVGSDNLCMKAYELLNKKIDLPPVKIHLHKIIPFGSGMGGGSADAAFTLKCLNSIFSLELTNTQLKEFAMEMGSDCGFFIENKVTFVEGRGEILNSVSLDLSNYYIVILNPGIHISTKEAYSYIIPEKPEIQLNERIKLPIEKWNDYIKNDFEDNILNKYPKIKECKDLLKRIGAVYTSMTGSGSAVYGIYHDKPAISNLIPKEYLVWNVKMGEF